MYSTGQRGRAVSRYSARMGNGNVVVDRPAGPLPALLAAIEAPRLPLARTPSRRFASGVMEDAGLALLLAYAVPVGILLVGMPVALLARLAFELVARLAG